MVRWRVCARSVRGREEKSFSLDRDKKKLLNDGSYELRAVGLPAQHLS